MGGSLNSDIDADLVFQSDSFKLMNSLTRYQLDNGSIWVPLATRVPRFPQVFTPSESDIILFVIRTRSWVVMIQLFNPFFYFDLTKSFRKKHIPQEALNYLSSFLRG